MYIIDLYMVFPDRSTRGKKGEIALTLTVISLVLMAMGALLGVTRTQDVRSRASAGSVQCGQYSCKNNSECAQNTGFLVLCHLSSGQCRPASSTDVCPGGGTARADTTKKDVGGLCSSSSDCKSGLSCLSRTCSQTSTGGGGGSSGGGATAAPLATPTPGAVPQGTAFQVTSLPCKIDFTFQWDPEIEYIRISKLDGSQTYDLTNDKVRKTVPAGESGPIGWEFVFPRGRSSSIAVSFTFDINDVFTHISDGPRNVSYYLQRPTPDWLNGGEGYNIDIGYKYVIGGVDKHAHQVGTSKACTSNTPVQLSPTPTLTFRSGCGGICTTDSQCRFENPNLICRRKLGSTSNTTYCHFPTTDSCSTITPPVTSQTPSPTIPSRTPTPTTPTRTPTPSLTLTPTASPTPTLCNKSVYFMIDNSSTQAGIPQAISSELSKYFAKDENDYNNISFSYDTFNLTVEKGGRDELRGVNFNIPSDRNWTNINAALDALGSARSDKGTQYDAKIFISDGIPTVKGASINGKSIQCAYRHDPSSSADISSSKLDGCEPKLHHPKADLNISQCNGRYNPGNRGTSLQTACGDPYLLSSANATHNVMAVLPNGKTANGETPIKAGVVAAGGKHYETSDKFIADLPNILNSLCPTTPTGGGLLGDTQRPRTFMSTFTVQNKSNKAVQSVNVKTCNQAGSGCLSFLNTVGVQPQTTGRFSQVIPDSVPLANRALVTCDVNYTDGSSLPCPKKQTQNESIQFNLTVNNKAVSGSSKTFSQAADINNDGRVNAIDCALCQRQIGSTSTTKSCDIVSDNVVNAQDISVCVERLGQSSK